MKEEGHVGYIIRVPTTVYIQAIGLMTYDTQ